MRAGHARRPERAAFIRFGGGGREGGRAEALLLSLLLCYGRPCAPAGREATGEAEATAGRPAGRPSARRPETDMADDWDDGQGEPRAGSARTAPLPAAPDIPGTAQRARAPAHCARVAIARPHRVSNRSVSGGAGMGAGVEGAPAEAAAATAAYVALRPAAAPDSPNWEEEGGTAGG